jgi:5-methyltetrahydrofolate--homocysteine methyltransferase
MLFGRYPDIFKDEKVGEEATKLYNDALVMLDKIVREKRLVANGVIAFYPAEATDSDDVLVFKNEEKTEKLTTLHFLRQQNKKAKDLPNFCLSDLIAPSISRKKDYIGMFAVTTGGGIESLIDEYKAQQDDYNEIMVKALADRLAEAFAELMHEKVRREYWGYAKGESLTTDDLIKEEYIGIRPAPGYPACPDHTEKDTIFNLLDAEREVGIKLTESFAMYPASSVSGYYFANPESKYFGLGKIEKDQVVEYAQRKEKTVEEIEKWLSPNLAY